MRPLFPRSVLFLLGVLFLSLNTPLLAQTSAQPQEKPLQIITLKDGTVLKGYLVGVVDDQYVIQTQHLGQVKIPVPELVSITTAAAALPVCPRRQFSGGSPLSGQMSGTAPLIQKIQQDLLSDPELSSNMQELANDEEIVNLLLDPNLVNALMSMDPQAIQNNPNTQKLLQSPKMQEIIMKVQQRMGVSSSGMEGNAP